MGDGAGGRGRAGGGLHGKRTGAAEGLRRWNGTAGELLAHTGASPTAGDGAGAARAVLGEEYADVADREYARR